MWTPKERDVMLSATCIWQPSILTLRAPKLSTNPQRSSLPGDQQFFKGPPWSLINLCKEHTSWKWLRFRLVKIPEATWPPPARHISEITSSFGIPESNINPLLGEYHMHSTAAYPNIMNLLCQNKMSQEVQQQYISLIGSKDGTPFETTEFQKVRWSTIDHTVKCMSIEWKPLSQSRSSHGCSIRPCLLADF